MNVNQGCMFTTPFKRATLTFLKKKFVAYKFLCTSGINMIVTSSQIKYTVVDAEDVWFLYFLKKIIKKKPINIFNFKLFRHEVIFQKLILL